MEGTKNLVGKGTYVDGRDECVTTFIPSPSVLPSTQPKSLRLFADSEWESSGLGFLLFLSFLPVEWLQQAIIGSM